MLILTLFLQVTEAEWWRLMLPLKVSSSGWWFRHLIPLWRGFPPFSSVGDSKRLVLMGDWNAILDPKIDKVRQGTSWLGRSESSLVDRDLVDRFRLDHPGREMWAWLDSSHSAKESVRRADRDFVSCPT